MLPKIYFQAKGQSLGTSMSSVAGSNMEWETKAEDLENDESFSDPLTVILPRTQDG